MTHDGSFYVEQKEISMIIPMIKDSTSKSDEEFVKSLINLANSIQDTANSDRFQGILDDVKAEGDKEGMKIEEALEGEDIEEFAKEVSTNPDRIMIILLLKNILTDLMLAPILYGDTEIKPQDVILKLKRELLLVWANTQIIEVKE